MEFFTCEMGILAYQHISCVNCAKVFIVRCSSLSVCLFLCFFFSPGCFPNFAATPEEEIVTKVDCFVTFFARDPLEEFRCGELNRTILLLTFFELLNELHRDS